MEKIISKLNKANKSNTMRLLYGLWAIIGGKQPLLRNYGTDVTVDVILEKILRSETPILVINQFNIELENSDYSFEAWDANKYYAWLNKGSFENKKNGYKYKWDSKMPSRFMAQLFLDYTQELNKKSILQTN